MVPLQNFATTVLTDVIRRQPDSPARTAFAWQVAVGPALARSTSVELRDRVLLVRARDPQWAREVERARETILARMQSLLGASAVARLDIAA